MQTMSMKRASWRARIGAILLAGGAVMLSACGLLADQPDETAGWSANKLYSEAKDALDGADYTRAVKLYESWRAATRSGAMRSKPRSTRPTPTTRDGETAAALAAVDRFIQLHPNHANIDYAYYLKGLINFNDNWAGWAASARPERTRSEGSTRGLRRLQYPGHAVPGQQVHA